MISVPKQRHSLVKEVDVIMQKNKEVYERSILTVTEFEKEDVITTSSPLDPILNIFKGGDNESMFQNR